VHRVSELAAATTPLRFKRFLFLNNALIAGLMKYGRDFETVVREPPGVRGGLPGGPRASPEILKCSIRKTTILAHIFR